MIYRTSYSLGESKKELGKSKKEHTSVYKCLEYIWNSTQLTRKMIK